ncbi:MAG: carboxypeptidase-like regulatory domain-containing protein [Polaribacter sp.]
MKTIKTFTFKKQTLILFGVFLSLFFFSNSLTAQEIAIKGVIKGKTLEKTEVLNGANIFLKGTKTGTSSNRKGEFTFPQKLKIGDILEVSYLGFVTKRIKIRKNATYLTINLQEDDNEMLGALNSNKRFKSKRTKQ